MTHTQTTYTNRIALCAGKKGARPAEVGALASVFEKSATELKQSKLLKCKQTLQICEDTGCCPEDLPRVMNDREEWRERVRDIRATSAI